MSSTEALQPKSDCVLYVIDAKLPLFSEVLQAVCSSIMQIQHNNDRRFQIGLLLYNTCSPSVRELLPLGNAKIIDLQMIMSIAQGRVKYEPSEGSSFCEVLNKCRLLFFNRNVVAFNRIVVITADSRPFQPSEIEEAQSLSHSLVQMGVLMVPMFLSDNFDPVMWSKLAYMPPEMSTASINSNLRVSMEPINIKELHTSLVDLVCQKAERKPVEFRGHLLLQNQVIGVCGYKIVKPWVPQRPISVIKTNQGAYEEVKRDSETPESKSFYLRNTDEKISISQAELNDLRNNSEPHRLLVHCFIPRPECAEAELLRLYTSTLIIPSNYKISFSKPAFSALHRSMSRKNIVGVATYTSNRPPILGLLYPVKAGLYFVKIPFLDDTRDLPLEFAGSANNQRLDEAVSTLLSSIRQSDFDPARFPHPYRQQFSRVLNYQALGKEYAEIDDLYHEMPDPTQPKYAEFSTSTCQSISELLENYSIYTEDGENKRRKRTLSEFQDAAAKNILSTFTVAELKWALRESGLGSTGKKADLIARIQNLYK